MGNFRRDNRNNDHGPRDFGKRNAGGKSFGGGGRGFGGRDSGRETGRPAMYKATCSTCGKDCEVPFRPSGSRPIYCSFCFDKQENTSSRGPANRSFDRPRFSENRKPDWQRNDQPAARNTPQFIEQFDRLNAKLDKIIQALSTPMVDEETLFGEDDTAQVKDVEPKVVFTKEKKIRKKTKKK